MIVENQGGEFILVEASKMHIYFEQMYRLVFITSL